MSHLTQIQVKQLVDGLVDLYRREPIDLLRNGGGLGEARYLEMLTSQYVNTILDLDRAFPDRSPANRPQVVEIGSFLGLVCLGLQQIDFQMSALDIPEFQKNPNLISRLDSAGVKVGSVNLRDYHIPLPSGSADALIFCETLEHLNFNPLPVLQEMNRVLKPGGLLYLTVPNLLCARNRLRILRGQSILNHPKDYFLQLDATSNMIVGLHWREYAKDELLWMLGELGFQCESHRFYQESKAHRLKRLKFSLKDVLGIVFPQLRPIHMVHARKTDESKHAFHFTDATQKSS